jgi:hypothetical protein
MRSDRELREEKRIALRVEHSAEHSATQCIEAGSTSAIRG